MKFNKYSSVQYEGDSLTYWSRIYEKTFLKSTFLEYW